MALDRLQASPGINVAPDTEGAVWEKLAQDDALRFGKPGSTPLVSISCEAKSEVGPAMRFVRYAPADPGAKAMLAVIGNGRVIRIKVDAVRHADGWRWEGLVPAGDIHLEVFAGQGTLEATLPGGGTFRTVPAALPAQLFKACRERLREQGPPAGQV